MKRTSALAFLVSGGVVTVSCNAIFGLDAAELDPTVCSTAQDCDDADPCTVDACQARHCISILAPTTELPEDQQDSGDCQRLRCSADGKVESVNQETDLPEDDDSDCTDELCFEGEPLHEAHPIGERCSSGLCDDTGECVACLETGDCMGTTEAPINACRSYECDAGKCTPVYKAMGFPLAVNTTGDCKKTVCDGSGEAVEVPDETDPYDDHNDCTLNLCESGTIINAPDPAATTCGDGGMLNCDGADCVGCVVPSHCGQDDFCLAWSCSSDNVCSFNAQHVGQATPNQQPQDCLEEVCNDNAQVELVASDNPDPDGIDCTIDACADGNQIYTSAAVNASCDDMSGSYCDGNGACVECNSGTQCPMPSGECKLRTCAAHTCGEVNAPNGSVLPTQTPGDCHKRICQNGMVVNSIDNGDIPGSSGYCTFPACAGGNPIYGFLPEGSVCGDSSTRVCSGSGTCVECAFDYNCSSGQCCGQSSGGICMGSGGTCGSGGGS